MAWIRPWRETPPPRKSTGHQTPVHQVVGACAEARGIRCEEVDHLGHLFGSSGAAAHVERILPTPVVLDAAVVLLGKLYEQVVDQRRADRAGADGIDPDVLRPQVDGQAAGDLPEDPLGHSVGEAVGLAHEPLVRGVDDDRAAARLDDRRYGLPQGIDRAVDVRLDHQIELLVGNVENRVAAVDARIGKDAVQRAEAGDGSLDRPADVSPHAGVAFGEEQPLGAVQLLHKRLGRLRVDIHKADVPAFGDKFPYGGGADSGRTSGDENGLHVSERYCMVVVCSSRMVAQPALRRFRNVRDSRCCCRIFRIAAGIAPGSSDGM